MPDISQRLEDLVLAVHRRNGGQLQRLEFGARLLAPELRLDSLDLAELMVAIEREFGVSPFDAPQVPRTWNDIRGLVEAAADRGKQEGA